MFVIIREDEPLINPNPSDHYKLSEHTFRCF